VYGLITSVDQETDNRTEQFSAYPQPASDELSLLLPGRAGVLRIVDALGRTVDSINVTEFDLQNITVNTSRFSNGSYVAIFKTATQQYITSFVIQR
jgi:hypothetical protein